MQKIYQQKAKIKEAIELLKEYRTSLITNAVTGKIDVRKVAIP
ncbi:type I restriction endonuclease subunit S [Nodularia spumigena CS-584]|uniref:Type I restriction endonuclease subunit S n=1 Tax=Nodularia spumigena UHCC 0060 TaxID=3110300 RepID=A0ABU5UV92_NODSP|nr:type I restriction endonuclease subunit S [Nodularia spumigena]MDB9381574.1 type I restriction endonuclease subunit S [Nodularia spumigena CS-584]MEA5526582.1 type I restriction endonuclease subunit S [Nodularia spumigena UHCC 0143]MEA5556841.1 type I restriction endonuclease subunit S [Nodularia spumigena CH309]MEA5609714.1 type I restriction endonuclease subunit S [Nodularia spumigena UHCC 0060]MEA5612931.1 type I restriction endonuclease subunit S [Nodularia spumigena UHCC 0040]